MRCCGRSRSARNTAFLTAIDRKSTRLNSSHTEIYTLSLHDALPISTSFTVASTGSCRIAVRNAVLRSKPFGPQHRIPHRDRSEEHTSELQSHRDLHSFPTRCSSDLDQLHGGEHGVLPDRGEECGVAVEAVRPATPHSSPR